ncbi:hypothetical protein COCVIDRAFT_91813, partial [Bipolaris victoriae FI3]
IRISWVQRVACLYNHVKRSAHLVPCSDINTFSSAMPNREFMFFLKHTHLASPRPTRFMDGTSTVRFIEQNLTVPESTNNRELHKFTPIVPKQLYLNPNAGAASHCIKRKSLPHAAQDLARTVNKRASHHDNGVLLPPLPIHRSPEIPHRTIRFEDFVPEHKLKTWHEMDDDKWRDARTNSISILITNIIDKFRYQVRKITRYTSL